MAEHDKDQHRHDVKQQEAETGTLLDRREALKRMGKYAAYTAPATLVLLTPEKKASASSPDNNIEVPG